MPECGEAASANCPDCDDAPGGEDNFDDSVRKSRPKLKRQGMSITLILANMRIPSAMKIIPRRNSRNRTRARSMTIFQGRLKTGKHIRTTDLLPRCPVLQTVRAFLGANLRQGRKPEKFHHLRKTARTVKVPARKMRPASRCLCWMACRPAWKATKGKSASFRPGREKKSSEPADEVRESAKRQNAPGSGRSISAFEIRLLKSGHLP